MKRISPQSPVRAPDGLGGGRTSKPYRKPVLEQQADIPPYRPLQSRAICQAIADETESPAWAASRS